MESAPKRNNVRRSAASGAVVYPTNEYWRNHVIWPGTEQELDAFVKKEYHRRRLKFRPAHSSNSEDALTWSCFNTLRHLNAEIRAKALEELWWLAFDGMQAPAGVLGGEIRIGQEYRVVEGTKSEETEVDVSIEGSGVLGFIEAKLYSPLSLADPKKNKPYDQIGRKLRVGVREAFRRSADFYFIILDIAPAEILRGLQRKRAVGFGGKWVTADAFHAYKGRRGSNKPLQRLLADIPEADTRTLARRMGWLNWADVFKVVLRAVIASRSAGER